jgi:4-hydroxybenzoate polyprenyltransferase
MLPLYVGCVLWTIGYDTIYAHQDKEDDAVLGLKSTALRFGTRTKPWLVLFYTGALVCWIIAFWLAGAVSGPAWVALALVAGHLAWQVATLDIDDPANCLTRFRSNRDLGLLLYAGLVVEMWAG